MRRRVADSRFCQECGTAGRSQVVDMICFSIYQDHDVDDDPVISHPCGHFFAVSTLDGCLEIGSVNDTDEAGKDDLLDWVVKEQLKETSLETIKASWKQ
jgi:hypothetical protein